jgi:hypothetical protein
MRRGLVAVLMVVFVVVFGTLAYIEAFTSIKPFARASCAVEQWEHSEFGGRERVWNDYEERCEDGLGRYYR